MNRTFAEFVAAQDPVYPRVLRELSLGRKESHWIWFVFPQLAGLGASPTSKRFALASKAEARAYWEHPVLGARLRECTRLVLAFHGRDISSIMGSPDDLKFRSSMTLFAEAVPEEPVFKKALEKFFDGKPDPRTLELLE